MFTPLYSWCHTPFSHTHPITYFFTQLQAVEAVCSGETMRTCDKMRHKWCRFCKWLGPKYGSGYRCLNKRSRNYTSMVYSCDKFEVKC